MLKLICYELKAFLYTRPSVLSAQFASNKSMLIQNYFYLLKLYPTFSITDSLIPHFIQTIIYVYKDLQLHNHTYVSNYSTSVLISYSSNRINYCHIFTFRRTHKRKSMKIRNLLINFTHRSVKTASNSRLLQRLTRQSPHRFRNTLPHL